MIDTGFVIGNGSSRIEYDLRQNFLDGIFYGCNAIHRHISCQYITITKQKHLAEAISWDIDKKSKIFTTGTLAGQLRNPNLNILPDPQFPVHASIHSGTGATLVAAHNHSNIFLFGFDFYLSDSVYFDTQNYTLPVKDEIINRMSGRRVHPSSGRSYHVIHNPPQKEGFDDITGEALIQREDDAPEVIKKRLDVYFNETEPLLDFYRNKNLKFIEIDASKSLEVVTKSIRHSISN